MHCSYFEEPVCCSQRLFEFGAQLGGFRRLRRTAFVAEGGVTRCCSTCHISKCEEMPLRCFGSSPVRREASKMIAGRVSRLKRCHCVACSYPGVRTHPSKTASAATSLLDAEKAWRRFAMRLEMLHGGAELCSRHCAADLWCRRFEEARRGG